MGTPVKSDDAVLETEMDCRPLSSVFRAVAAWHYSFFSDPLNRAAYAAWCEENGLEYDLQEPPPER